MRIGLVTACYKPVINGVTQMVALYKERLIAAGHEVTVFTLGQPDPAGEEAGVIRSPGIPLGETGYYIGVRYSERAQALLGQMEILHCHHLFMSVELAHRYGRCPIIYTNHTRYDLYTGTYTPLPQPGADALMRQLWPEFTDYCDVVIAPSASIHQLLLDFGVRRPIVLIENGVELARFQQPANPYDKGGLGVGETAVLALYVGRLAAEKNLAQLLNQFAIAQEICPTLHLLLIGQGPAAGRLQEQVTALGLQEQVTFAGAVPPERLPDYLAAADFFVTASVSEVHPLTVIEALAAGLPVAAVASPGIAETVTHGQDGYLTSQPDGGLAAAIVALAIDSKRRRALGAAGQEAVGRFDIDRTVERTLQLYRRLRRERPDLHREREHGRWRRRWPILQPLVEQLGHLLRRPRGER